MTHTLKVLAIAWLGTLALLAPARAEDPAAFFNQVRGQIGVQAGKYDFTQYNGTEIQKEFLDRTFGVQDADKQYYLDAVKSLRFSFTDFMNKQLYDEGGLVWMHDQAAAKSSFWSLEEYLAAVRRFRKAKEQFEMQVATVVSITSALPSQRIVPDKDAKEGERSVPNYGNIKFTDIEKFYQGRMEKLVAEANNLPQRVMGANKAPVKIPAGQSLTFNPETLGALDIKEVVKWRKDILEQGQWTEPEQEDDINEYTKYIRTSVMGYIERYGKKWYHLDAGEIQGRKDDAEFITQAMWSRSYLRAAYGMPIGTYALHYAQKEFNLDVWFTSTKSLAYIEGEPLWVDENKMADVEQAYRQAILRAGERSVPVMSGDLTWVRSARNIITYLAGDRNRAEAIYTMLNLLAADLYEEKLVGMAGGMDLMMDRYKARWKATHADAELADKWKNQYDPQDGKIRPGGKTFGRLSGKVSKVLIHMHTQDQRLERAEQIQAMLDAIDGNNTFTAARKKRIRDL